MKNKRRCQAAGTYPEHTQISKRNIMRIHFGIHQADSCRISLATRRIKEMKAHLEDLAIES